MKKIYLFLLFTVLSGFLHAQPIGDAVKFLFGDAPIGGVPGIQVVHDKASSGGQLNRTYSNQYIITAYPTFVKLKEPHQFSPRDYTDQLPAGFEIFLTGTKSAEPEIADDGDSATTIVEFLALATNTGGKDTILILISPLYPDKLFVNPYSFKSTCNGGTGSNCVQTFKKILGEGIYVLGQYLDVSHDNGKTWTIDSSGLGTDTYTINDVVMDKTLRYLYAATSKGLYKQDTVSDHWQRVTSYPGSQANLKGPVFIDRNNRLVVADAGTQNVYVSKDSAATWLVDTTGLNLSLQKTIISFADDAYNNLFAVTATGYTAPFHNIYRLPKDAPNWIPADANLHYNAGIYPFAITGLTGDSILFLNTSGGIFISGDTGTTWVSNNTATATVSVSGFVKTKPGRCVAGNALGLHYENSGDSVWYKTYPVSGFLSKPPLYQDSLGNIYTLDPYLNPSYNTYSVIKSSDNGSTWLPDTTGLYAIDNYSDNFFVDEKGGQHFFSPNNGVIWSKKAGDSWAVDSAGMSSAFAVYGIGTDGKGYLYSTGHVGGGAIRRRAINGTAWVIDTAGIPISTAYFPKMVSTGKNIFVYTNINTTGRLYYRGAAAWQSIPFPTNNSFYGLYVAAVSQDKSGYIYAAFYLNEYTNNQPYGVYYTKDYGQNWIKAGLDSIVTSGTFGLGVKSIVSYGDTNYIITEVNGVYAFTHNSALPVTISSIKAYQLGKGVQIEWSGYNEINMHGYEVERSVNGAVFNAIGTVAAKVKAYENNYTFFDPTPSDGDNFYKIKAISKDGTSKYSGIVKVGISLVSDMVIYPNPAQNKTINMQFNNIEAGNYSLVVYGVSGQKIYARVINCAGGNTAFAVHLYGVAKGGYWVVLKNSKHSYMKAVTLQ